MNIEKWKKDIVTLNTAAAKWFSDQLVKRDAAHVRQYILKAGLEKVPGLGYAPARGFAELVHELGKRGAPAEAISAAGLGTIDLHPLNDYFHDRMMIPLKDSESGDVIGFRGVLMRNGEPKYLNTRQNHVFTKEARDKADEFYANIWAKIDAVSTFDALNLSGEIPN